MVGVTIGLSASAAPNRLGGALMRVTDIGLAIPGCCSPRRSLPCSAGLVSLIVGLAGVFWAPLAGHLWPAVVTRNLPFIDAAKVLRGTPRFTLVRHVPHVLPVVAAYAPCRWGGLSSSRARSASWAGVQEPTPSIGNLLGCCLVYYRDHPGLILFPAIYLGLMVAGANLLGEALRLPPEAVDEVPAPPAGIHADHAGADRHRRVPAGRVDPRRPGTEPGRPGRIRADSGSECQAYEFDQPFLTRFTTTSPASPEAISGSASRGEPVTESLPGRYRRPCS